jgi:hypothetical protein
MKKFFSIGFALLILLSGMQLSLATHFCGGHIAAVKWSFTKEKATCGMEDPHATCPSQKRFTTHCCEDEIAVCSTDPNYNQSEIQLEKVYQTTLQLFIIPIHCTGSVLFPASFLYTNVHPPGKTSANGVKLSDICVFRI